ncbi:Hypothetical_protein [Hexamita inflata]|uniref:Hypothetical_protein n=1 Tax=Hexamita inflata TaxID=28002 RepID=A0AA86NQ32_9EUKA|nr:Hypothetical protein HINF_LOCUS10280 [Hexamita inflata]
MNQNSLFSILVFLVQIKVNLASISVQQYFPHHIHFTSFKFWIRVEYFLSHANTNIKYYFDQNIEVFLRSDETPQFICKSSQYKRRYIRVASYFCLFFHLCNHGKNNNPLTEEETALVAQVADQCQQLLVASVPVSRSYNQVKGHYFNVCNVESKAQKKKISFRVIPQIQITTAAQLCAEESVEEWAELENLDDFSSFYPFQDLFE